MADHIVGANSAEYETPNSLDNKSCLPPIIEFHQFYSGVSHKPSEVCVKKKSEECIAQFLDDTYHCAVGYTKNKTTKNSTLGTTGLKYNSIYF